MISSLRAPGRQWSHLPRRLHLQWRFQRLGGRFCLKKFFLFHTYQVDKPRHLIAPGWQDVSWRAWKSFSHRRGILPQSASSVPTQIASNHICGPHQQNVHFLYLASSIVIFSLFFCQEIRPVPIFCNQWGVKHLVPEHLGRRQYVRDLVNLFQVMTIHVYPLMVRATEKKKGGPRAQSF